MKKKIILFSIIGIILVIGIGHIIYYKIEPFFDKQSGAYYLKEDDIDARVEGVVNYQEITMGLGEKRKLFLNGNGKFKMWYRMDKKEIAQITSKKEKLIQNQKYDIPVKEELNIEATNIGTTTLVINWESTEEKDRVVIKINVEKTKFERPI